MHKAQEYLQLALNAYPESVLATMILGDIAVAEGKFQEAIDTWKRIENQNSQYLALVAERLLSAYRNIDRQDEGLALLREYLIKYHSLDLMNVVFEGVLKNDGPAEAYKLVLGELERNPTLLGLDKLLEARLLEVTTERRSDVVLVKDLVHKRTRNLAYYHCSNCGFKARQFYWHCPACHAWDSYSPRRNEETGMQV